MIRGSRLVFTGIVLVLVSFMDDNNNVQAVLPSKVPIGWLYLPAVGGANMSAYAPFSLAKKQLHADGVIPKNVELDIRWYYFECNPYNGSIGFIDLVKLHNVTGLIGPPCSMTGDVIGRLAVSWNILLISQKIESSMFTDKTLYRTLARTVLTSTSEMANAVHMLLETFGWRNLAVVHKDSYYNNLLLDAVTTKSKNYGHKHIFTVIDYKEDASAADLDTYLSQIRDNARIILVVLSWSFDGTKDLMLQALKRNMTGPDYVWIICRLEVPIDGLEPWREDKHLEKELKQAYRHSISIYPSAYDPEKLRPFRERVREEYYKLYPERSPDDYEFTQLQAALYDSLYAYGYVLNLSQSFAIQHDDGRGMFNLLKMKRIPGATAPIIFDINVERAPTYTVMTFDAFGSYTEAINIERKTNMLTLTYDFDIQYKRTLFWGTADNQPPLDLPPCGYKGELCIQEDRANIYVIVVGVVMTVVGFVIVAYFLKKRITERDLMAMTWQIDHSKLVPNERIRSSDSLSAGEVTVVGGQIVHSNFHDRLPSGLYDGQHCHIFKYATSRELRLSREQLKLLNNMKSLNHENLCLFFGMSASREQLIILWGCTAKKTLRDILGNEDMNLDDDFLATFLRGAVDGLRYIHHRAPGVHGNLTSENIFVDNRLVIKISNYGMTSLTGPMIKEGLLTIQCNAYDLYHCAPELLADMATEATFGTKSGDIYSLGMILYQIVARRDLYYDYEGTQEELLVRIRDKGKLPMRPSFPDNISPTWLGVVGLIKDCWRHQEQNRPTIDMVNSAITVATSQFRGNIIEKMIHRMERYTTDLEKVVSERTAEVHAQHQKAERLLRQMLPKSVADRLQAGLPVLPESFDSATILFTDIVRFTDMSAKHTPIEVVALLNDIYSNFDELIDKHDAYKVETIGDAVMVVSGLPKKNDEHASAIAALGLALRDFVREFKMPFIDEQPLRIRLGAHTGPVATAVVGIKMPRYCLFGDTVNMASRMEKLGIPMRLHVTEDTKSKLVGSTGLELVLRGKIEIKGKGVRSTYFVEKQHGK